MISKLEEGHCALSPAAGDFGELARTVPDLWIDEFNGLTDEGIFSRFDHAIYIPEEESTEDEVLDADQRWRFNFLTNRGEQFDHLKGFLACEPGGDVLMILRMPEESLLSHWIDLDLFISVASAFSEWVEFEERRLW